MPIRPYGVLAGRAVEGNRETDPETPHYQVRVRAGDSDYRLAVNVKSRESPSELLFLVDADFHHPVTGGLAELPVGFSALPPGPGGLALDFIRGNLFDRLAMRPLPFDLPGPSNDLSDQLEHFVHRAIQEEGTVVYAFGERWGPEPHTPDKIFHFSPGNGVHNIHMNQGNSPAFARDDGVWQDGALLLHFPTLQQWVGVFLAFQSQAWHTDDASGHAVVGPDLGPGHQPDPSEPDFVVRIVGAMVNPRGPAPEQETVTLLNTSPDVVDLRGWSIADKLKRKHPIAGTIAPGAALPVPLAPPVQLGNSGGIITLLDPRGLKVHGVAYTRRQAEREGWTIAF